MKENLANVVNSRARKVKIRGKQAIVPLLFDENENPAAVDRLIFKRLSLNDLRFLKALRDSSWAVPEAAAKVGLAMDKAHSLVKRLAVFREEDARVKALCEIPTPEWIAAKHVQNVYEGGTLEDSQQKSLAELAKIEGAYKNNSVSIVQNVFNLPKLTPEVEAKFKQLAEEAIQVQAI